MLDLKLLIPGYNGYRSQKLRREDDRLTREFVIKRIEACKAKLDAIGVAAANQSDFDTPVRIERFRNELDRARARVNAAVDRYTGWFGTRDDIDEETLEQISRMDENLVAVVDLADQLIVEKPLPDEKLTEAIELLHQRIDRRAALLSLQ